MLRRPTLGSGKRWARKGSDAPMKIWQEENTLAADDEFAAQEEEYAECNVFEQRKCTTSLTYSDCPIMYKKNRPKRHKNSTLSPATAPTVAASEKDLRECNDNTQHTVADEWGAVRRTSKTRPQGKLRPLRSPGQGTVLVDAQVTKTRDCCGPEECVLPLGGYMFDDDFDRRVSSVAPRSPHSPRPAAESPLSALPVAARDSEDDPLDRMVEYAARLGRVNNTVADQQREIDTREDNAVQTLASWEAAYDAVVAANQQQSTQLSATEAQLGAARDEAAAWKQTVAQLGTVMYSGNGMLEEAKARVATLQVQLHMVDSELADTRRELDQARMELQVHRAAPSGVANAQAGFALACWLLHRHL